MNNYDMLMTVAEIRKAINIDTDDWINHYRTNCYAYALGLDIPENEITAWAYSPGVIGKSNIFLPEFRTFPVEYLIQNMMLDFKALGISCQNSSPSAPVDDDTWKIALFITYYEQQVDDFHFLRQHRDGYWYHKNGWSYSVKKNDDYGIPIINPEECHLRDRTYNRCLALTLKKH